MPIKNDHKAYILLSLTMLFWAGNVTIARGTHEQIPPIFLSWIRWTLAALVILPLARPHLIKDAKLLRENFWLMMFLGTVGVAAFNSLQYTALNFTTSINVLVLQSGTPLFIAMAAYVIFSDRISWRQTIGIAISTIGVLIILCQGNMSKLLELEFAIGDLIMLVAVACWSIYTVVLRKRPDIHPLSFAATTFVIGSVMNLPIMLTEYAAGNVATASIETYLTIAYVSIFPSVLAYLFFNKAVEYIGATRTGSFGHLVPVIGAILAMIFLDEIPQAFHLIGFALILSGIWLSVVIKTPRQET